MNDTITGALIGGCVSLFAIALAQKLSAKKERVDVFRNKLEELYLLTNNLTIWNAKSMTAVTAAWERIIRPTDEPSSPPNWEDQCPFDRISMLVNLYFPRLSDSCRLLGQAEDILRNGFSEFIRHTTGTPQDVHSLDSRMLSPASRVSDAIKLFQSAIVSEVKRFT